MAAASASIRRFVAPTITDYGSIADHTFGSLAAFGLSPARIHCNSGGGNGPEGNPNSTTWIDPRDPGGSGRGSAPTDDCDPGKSGPVNHGKD